MVGEDGQTKATDRNCEKRQIAKQKEAEDGNVGESNITGKDQEKKKRAIQTKSDDGKGKRSDRENGQVQQAKAMDVGSRAGTTGEGKGKGRVRWY